MLVLERRIDESVVLVVPGSATETRITVMVTETSRSKARIGFNAPPHVRIVRYEVLARAET